jgi:hypothetical protein
MAPEDRRLLLRREVASLSVFSTHRLLHGSTA